MNPTEIVALNKYGSKVPSEISGLNRHKATFEKKRNGSSKWKRRFLFGEEKTGNLEVQNVTPPKTNMSPENQWLEDVFPIEMVPF